MFWVLIAAQAAPWHVPTHQRRVRMTFTNPTTTAFTNFPLLVKLTPDRVDYSLLDANGYSLVVVDDAGTPLDFHIDDWDGAGDSWIWVRIPDVGANGSEALWVYYDTTVAVPPDPSDPQAVWIPAVWLGVWPMDRFEDVTLRHPVTYFGNNPNDEPGPVGSSRYFSGDDYIRVDGAENDFDIDNITLSAWVRRDGWGATDWTPVISKGDESWRLHRRGLTDGLTFSVNNNGVTQPAPSQDLQNDTWTQVHAVYSTSFGLRMYLDGQEVASETANGNIDNQNERVWIGGNENHPTRFWIGWLDMVSVQSTPRGPNWVTLDHLSQTDALLARCDSGPGLSENTHDADGDGVPCDVDCDDSDNGVGRLFEDGDGDGEGGAPSDSCVLSASVVDNSDDCDDGDAAVNTQAAEVCNGVDDDCEGTIDQGATDESTWFADVDGDAYGDASDSVVACNPPTGFVLDDQDCNDASDQAFPGGTEVCDTLDNDCDGSVDNGAAGAATWYADTDDDGYGDPLATQVACTQPAGFQANASDCDDTSAQAFPGGTEVCDSLDNDCNGVVDDSASDFQTFYLDFDGDGFGVPNLTTTACSAPAGYADNSDDCDDALGSVNPSVSETCNGIDDDCSGAADEGLTLSRYPDGDGDGYGANVVALDVCPSLSGYVDGSGDCDDSDAGIGLERVFFRDQDGDQFGDAASSTTTCFQPVGFVQDATDCDDLQILAFPGNLEICDGVDNDCDGGVDLGIPFAPSWYPDADGDGHGESGSSPIQACVRPPDTAASLDDCDDGDATVFPTATEACNGVDNDCNGLVDDGVADRTWFHDDDGDGYGGAAGTEIACAPPPGQVGQGTDCDDSDAAINPNGTEVCNGEDDDCDGTVDVGASDVVQFFTDADGDGFGSLVNSVYACDAPSGFVAGAGDCNDNSAASAPGETELCDGEDNDCNGLTDDGDDRVDVWPDQDGDGFGDATLPPISGCPGAAFVTEASDCNDLADTVFPESPTGDPAAEEVCDLLDNDCDGLVDDADPDVTTVSTFWADADGDGYGDPASSVEGCAPPPGTTDNADDCDDTTSAVSPSETEIPGNGVDDDCDGVDGNAIDTAETGLPPDDTDPVLPPVLTGDTGDLDTDPAGRPSPNTGCNCDQGGTPLALWGGILALVAVRRRSRRE